MAILIGTDEAGYGPNLGPLVISASRWYLPDHLFQRDLYDLLSTSVTRELGDDHRVVVGDSKKLYTPGKGLRALETGVQSLALAMGGELSEWKQAWRFFAPTSVLELERLPWYQSFRRRLPVEAKSEQTRPRAELLRKCFEETGISLQRLEAVAVFPDRFNQLVDQLGSKGGALSEQTLALVKRMVAGCDDTQILVQCDKHGGRNRYGPLLQQQFPDYLVEVVKESRASSVYRWGPAQRRVEFRFVAQGESFLPAAVASMLSKYLRELAMGAFNAFWQRHLPEIKPTAGYPVDAKRFRTQIRVVQTKLGIVDQVLWRNR